MKQYIGFLDSGIGGVSVLGRAIGLLPDENYIFYSDSQYNPYGDKTDNEVIARCNEIADYLVNERNCKAVVIACNTASARAAEFLRNNYKDIPIIAIEPAYKMVHDYNPEGFSLVMATKGTIESSKFHKLFYEYYNENTSILPCVGLADLIENDDKVSIKNYLNEKLDEYKGIVRNVVLGCTHYPLIKEEIKSVLGDVTFFDGAEGVSRQLKKVLTEREMLSNSDERGEVIFTDSSLDENIRLAKEKRFYSILEDFRTGKLQ